VAAALLLGFTGVEYRNVRARENAVLGPFPADKTIREAQLLGNAVAGLRGARVQPGARIAFVNPAPPLHFAVADPRRVPNANVSSYVPVEGAMRHGQAVRLFLPGVEYLGFARRLPREWEDAEVFLYRDDGGMRALGRGSRALAELGYFTLRTRQWAAADSMFQRSRALGDTLADATFGLIITSGYLGRQGDERRYAEEFLRRWPDDARAATVAQGLRRPPGDAAR